MTQLRKGLPPVPGRMLKLPLDHRGYLIPWFVATQDDGTRDFRFADERKRVKCAKERLCWLCGEKMGRYMCFVVGPMCVVNRNTSEPGCHKDCAVFAVTACPFLMRPQAKYRLANLPDGGVSLPHGLPGNPGAAAIYTTETFKPYRTGGSWLIELGAPHEVSWWAEGKIATRQQILDSLDARLPLLREVAAEHGEEIPLQKAVDRAMELLPA